MREVLTVDVYHVRRRPVVIIIPSSGDEVDRTDADAGGYAGHEAGKVVVQRKRMNSSCLAHASELQSSNRHPAPGGGHD